MSAHTQKIAVIGAGAWGTALAANAVSGGHDVHLWARNPEVAATINTVRKNPTYLDNIALPDRLNATSDLAQACNDSTIIMMCVPAQTLKAMTARAVIHSRADVTLISCAKGIDRATGKAMTDTMRDVANKAKLAVLSGPSFAVDVARLLPTAVTIAAYDHTDALDLCRTLSNDTLRCYASDDVPGVEFGGALKNVLAIAVGIARGRALGASAEAALIARGFAEMSRIAVALGGRSETLSGLSGLGDLVLTCSSEKSRNFAYGIAIGCDDNLTGRPLAEGVNTARIASYVARRAGIDAPLVDTVTAILEAKTTVDDAVAALLARPLKSE